MTTIFAVATPPGVSGVAVMRVSGPAAFEALQALGGSVPPSRRAALRQLKSPKEGLLIDTALVLAFPGPESFTGEDVVELQCHGSFAVLNALAEALTALGLRPAEPGEFARRALQNGKIDLIGAEALDALISARDTAQLRIAQGQAAAARQAVFDGFQESLLTLMAGCEALIDFPDEDLPTALVAENQQRLGDLTQSVAALLQRSRAAQQIDKGLEILLVGPPNVGKSTLLNALAGYERAIVTDQAGTTRDFVELDMTLGPFQITFVDTAGLNPTAKDAVEIKGMARTEERLSTATLILNMFETGSQPLPLPHQAKSPIWPIETKVSEEREGAIGAGESHEPGLAALLARIEAWMQEVYGPILNGLSFQKERQVFHVKQMHDALVQAASQDALPELQGESLRLAAQALGHLSGKIHVEDVLDRLFAGFCIGK